MGDPVRYFRSTPAVYETVRATLDSAYGYPNSETKTETVIPPASELAVDAEGRVYLYMSEEYCNYILPSQLLTDLLSSGAVEEMTEAEFWLAVRPTTPNEG
jgi:hypothetical protein